MGHTVGHHHREDERSDRPGPTGNGSSTFVDPVSHHGLEAGAATTSTVYKGRAYYFESRDNRDALESNPETYFQGVGDVGEPVGVGANPDRRQQHHHHGC